MLYSNFLISQKMVLDTAFLSTQHYKVRIKGKVEQSLEDLGSESYGKKSHWPGGVVGEASRRMV